MKLSNRLEDIFSHAVALTQSGRLRSTVYCLGRKVYILNQDHTVLMRFRLRKTDKLEFDSPVSFHANDYDSQEVEERDGRICFIQSESGFQRTKSCRTPALDPEEVDRIFRKHGMEESNSITLHSQLLGLLNDNLSHIEFSCEDGEFLIVQRNIYSGSVIRIKRRLTGGLMEVKDDMEDFDPVGLRTNDFMALFTFIPSLRFHFKGDGYIWVESKEDRMPMRALVSQCRYDELGGTVMVADSMSNANAKG